MSLFIASLNSGSNGNCYYVGNTTEAVLIDAGLSCRETEKRMLRLGLSMSKVKAVFISHEHSDHIFGLATLSCKHKLPVYVTNTTFKQSKLKVDQSLIHFFSSHQKIKTGSLVVTAFPKLHDACDPHSFVVSDGNISVGIFTDIGKPCEQVIKYFKECDAVFLEANYDAEMLAAGRYPYFLKKRISGGYGHLSNAEALELFLTCKSAKLTHLILSHLSKNNNSPELVNAVFSARAGNVKIIIASRYKETEVYHLQPSTIKKERIFYGQTAVQLSIF